MNLEDSRAVVRVRDDGKGIPEQTAKFRPRSVGVGVSGMRQRIKEFGGELLLHNANPGTFVEAAIPIKASTNSAMGAAATWGDYSHTVTTRERASRSEGPRKTGL